MLIMNDHGLDPGEPQRSQAAELSAEFGTEIHYCPLGFEVPGIDGGITHVTSPTAVRTILGGSQAEVTLADISREFTRWHCWEGIAGMLYASRRNCSPPVVVRGEDPQDLRDAIRRWLADN